MLLRPSLIRPAVWDRSGLMNIGVNLGNIADPQELYDYESWLGRPVNHVEIFNGDANWDDVANSIDYNAQTFYGTIPRWRWLTIHPLPASGATLADAAAGAYNNYYITCARACLRAAWPKSRKIPIRPFHEFNLSQQNHYAVGAPGDLRAAFRQLVMCFRSVDPDAFVFRWCPNRDDSGLNLADYYPGDDVVDIISIDHYVYFGGGGFTGDPTGANNYYWTTNNGKVGWIARFARTRGKPWGVDEWGCSADGFESYIAAGAAYLRNWGASYHAWWEETAAYNSELHTGNLGTTGTAFQTAFGLTPPTPWTPASLGAAPTRWFNAQTALVGSGDGTSISSATDGSSNAAHWTQGTGGSQPTAQTVSGKRTLRFDGVDDVMIGSGPGALGAGVTTMAVCAAVQTGTTGSRHAFSFGNASAGQHRTIARIGSPSNAFRLSANGSNNDHDVSAVTWDASSGVPDIVVWTLDPGATSLESTVWINGEATPYTFNMTGTAINTASTNAYLGGRIGSSSEHWRGDVFEAVLVSGALANDAERQKLEGWLAWNNGAQSKLPAGHPYKSAAPTL